MRDRDQAAASNVEWERWGERDPFWGVASWSGREIGGVNPWTAGEFYALGLSDWQDFRIRLEQRRATFGTAVEIGAGAGRLTKHMASDFKVVIGVDVSPGMLATARSHVTEPNVEFRLGNGFQLPVDSASANVAFSTHVFQHFESLDLARSNFADIYRVLQTKSWMLVHLPTFALPRRRLPGNDIALAAISHIANIRAAVRRRRGTDFMRGLEYPWEWLFTELPLLGFTNIELAAFSIRSNGSVHHCVLAQKSEDSLG